MTVLTCNVAHLGPGSASSRARPSVARLLALAMLGTVVCWLAVGCSSSSPVEGAQEAGEARLSSSTASSSSADATLLPRWAGTVERDRVGRTWPPLRIHTESGDEEVSGDFSAVSATLSGRRIAYVQRHLEQGYVLSEEKRALEQKYGPFPPAAFYQLIVRDVHTGRKDVVAIFTDYPELHPKMPRVLRAEPPQRTWWSGEHILYAQLGQVSAAYRFDLRTKSFSMITLVGDESFSIGEARSSPEGKPLALSVEKDSMWMACLVDAESGKRVWSRSHAKQLCYSPSGRRLAWIEDARPESTDWEPVIIVKDLTTGIVRRYSPRSELLEGSYSNLWWIRNEAALVVAGPRPALGGLLQDIGVWKVGSARIVRVGLRTTGPNDFTPL